MLSSLDQRAQLQADTLQPDGGGGYTEAWQTFATVWVNLAPLAPAERFGPDRLEARIRHRIALRRRGDLAIGQRLVIGTRSFQIHGIEDGGPRRSLVTLFCEELP